MVNAVLYEKIRMKDVLKMNKGRQLQVAQVCRELKGIEKEIADILAKEEKLCEGMRARNAKPYARACATLYDAKDCVVAAQAFLKSMVGDALNENKPNPNL